MEADVIKDQLTVLRRAANGKDAQNCDDAINVLNDYFDVPRKQTEIKYAIDLMFKESEHKLDLQKFLGRSLHHKELHKSAMEILELIKKLTELFPINIQFYSDYIINKCCVPIIRDKKPGARFKEMSVKVINTIVVHKILDEEINIEQLIRDLMFILDQKVPKSGLFCVTFELLGILSKNHKECFQPPVAMRLRNLIVSQIQNLFKDDKAGVSLQLIGGAVESLKNLLENFTPTHDEDPAFLEKLYECMERLSDVDSNPHLNTDHNRIAFRNMLSIVHLYGHLVGDKFFENHKRWHQVLEKWINSKSYDDRIKGVNAAQTFYVEVGKTLAKRSDVRDKPVLDKFIKSFQETLTSPDSLPHGIRIAIRGFGAMAEAIKKLYGPILLAEYFDLIMQRAEHSFFKGENQRDNFQNLPNYIESLSEIMNQMSEISSTQAQALESVIVTLMKDFHFLSASHHEVTVMCLLKTFSNIEKAGDKIFEDIISSVVWQGVLWSCRHQLVYDVENNAETIKDWKEIVTYKKYLPLWKNLLADRDEKNSNITRVIYACFIKNLFSIINLLDLSMKKRKYVNDATEVEFFFTDPSLDLEPVRAENFQILYNLVQFYSDVITTQSVEKLNIYFMDWLEFWLEKSIQLAHKYPTISAFLYLVEVALVVIHRVNYSIDDMDNISQLKFFVKFLFSRCEHISGEYQVAILRLIFQSPPSLLKEYYNEEISAVYSTGFSLGKSILTVAHYAMTSFEKLIDCLSEDTKTRRSLLEAVLPHMETFLSNDDLQPIQSDVKQLRIGNRRKKRQVIFAVETDLMRIKKRIILFLGRCSPDEAHLFLSKCDQKLVRHNYLTDIFSVKLECNDNFSPIIYLDQILERVKSLALSSSDRSIRITACELLHGLVLYFMGKNLERDETVPMWKQLCCDLIILGADEDLTVRQIYEPLLIQITHYYSQPSKILSSLASSLIESLMLMISHKNNCIQDLSARLLREFIVWLFRQTNRNERESSPVRLLDLFQELKKMSIETNQSRKIGAALAFNNIYCIVKEEESLIDVYWIYLFDVFCLNFKSSEDFSDDLDSFFVDERRFQQLSICLDNISKDFIDRKYIFQQPSLDRIKPMGFPGIQFIDIIHWLLLQCAVQEYFYRQKCMNMFMKMLAESDFTAENYYKEFLNVEKVVEIGEGNGIARHPNLDFPNSYTESIYKEVYKWMKKLLSSLDFYTWIIEKKFIPSDEIRRLLGQTVIMNVIKEFLAKDIIQSINADSTQASYEMKMNNRNLEKIDMMRCVILIRILDFLGILLRQNINPSEIFEESEREALKLITKLIFKPQRLGFDYRTYNIISDLDMRLAKFLNSINLSSTNFSKVLNTKLQDKVIKYLDGFIKNCRKMLTARNVNELDKSKLKGISFLVTHQKESLLAFKGDLIMMKVEQLIQKLFDDIVEESNGEKSPLKLSVSNSLLATHMLRTCLKFNKNSLSKMALYCFDPTKLKRNSHEKIYKGEHFLQTYKTTILEFYVAEIEQSVDLFIRLLSDAQGEKAAQLRIINILTELNTHIYKNHHTDSVLLQKNLQALVGGWSVIRDGILKIEHDDVNIANATLINFLTNLAMVCPYELHILEQRLSGLKEWIFKLMNDKQLSLKVKTQAVRLIPCITSVDDTSNDELNQALEAIQKAHFPLRSHEFSKESLQRAGFMDCARAILQCLVISKSLIIFNFIINFTVQDDDFLLERELQEALKIFMDHLTEKQQENVLNRVFDFFINASYEPEIRLNVVTRYLLSLIKNARIETILGFFKQRVSQIYNLVNSRYDINLEIELMNCTGAFIIIEAFVASVPRDKIEASTFSIGGNLNDGKSLVNKFMLRARNVRNEAPPLLRDDHQKELYRKFQCYAYRALVTLVLSSSIDPKVYNLTLFQELPDTNKFIWQNLINIEIEELYSCCNQDFENFPKIKEYIVSIKDLNPPEDTKKNKYLSTTSIFDHTLSQTLTKSDLTYSVVLSSQKPPSHEELHQQNMKIKMESIVINNHEVMGNLIGVVQFMYTQKVSPFHDYEKHSKDKYKWIESIANSLRDHRQHKNVKIFIAKFIENCRTIFSNYAKILTGPILNVLTDGTLGDKMSFYITDLTTMLISWSVNYKPSDMQERKEAGDLFNFLLANAYHERNDIFKLNLELLKKLIETWRDILEDKISFATLIELLEHKDKRASGLQLNAVVLSNEIAPWGTEEQCERYVKTILKAFKSDAESKLCQPSAQLMGMCLNLISKDQTLLHIIEIVMEKLQTFEVDKKKSELLLDVLYGIHKNYPAIIDPFMARVTSSIYYATRKTKSSYLEMFLARLEIIQSNELFRAMTNFKIDKLLKQKEYQVICLHIINKSIDSLNSNEFMRFFDDIVYLLSSPNTEVRRIIYEIMIYSVEKYQENFPDKHKPMGVILKGFSEIDDQIQNRVVNFLNTSNFFGLADSYAIRFQELLTNYFNPSFEKEFLNYAAQLLLDISIRHPRSTRPLLTYDERNNSNFFELPIATKSFSQKSLPPAFVTSQRKQLLAGEGSQVMLQATASANDYRQFTPTLDPGSIRQVPQSFTLKHAQNSLLVSLKPQLLDIRSKPSQGVEEYYGTEDDRIIQRKQEASDQKEKIDSSLDYLRRRIVNTTPDQKSRQYAMRAVEKREFTVSKQKERISQMREGKEVILYRRYRYGDFPDFFFNTLAILLPLQSLVKKDSSIARDVFVTIFDSIVKTFQESRDDDGEKVFFNTINKSVTVVMENTKKSYSFLLSALIEMTITSDKYLDIKPDSLGNILPVNAILFLESQLMHLNKNNNRGLLNETEESQGPSKRQRMDYDDIKLQHWTKLIEFNYKIKEFEVISGIFTEKLQLKSDVKINLLRAIDYETNEKYNDALSIYEELLRAQTFQNSTEKEFYYNSYFNCLANLSDWETAIPEVQKQLDDYDEIWKKKLPFYQNTILPQLMKGELKKILKDKDNDGFLEILENWTDDDEKRCELLNKFPEEMGMFCIHTENFTECSNQLEEIFKEVINSWGSMEMYQDKLRLLMRFRTLAELYNFAELATTPNPQEKIEKMFNNWRISMPTGTDSLIYWSDLIAYRKEFARLSVLGKIPLDVRKKAESSLVDVECALLNVAFLQKNTDAAYQFIKKFKQVEEKSNENILKCNLSVGKYDLINAENKLSVNFSEALKKFGSAWHKLNSGVLEHSAVDDYKEIKIESLCSIGSIASKLATVYQKIDHDEIPQAFHVGFRHFMGAADDVNMTNEFLKTSEKFLKKARDEAQKYLEEDFSDEREKLLGNVYLKIGQFYRRIFSNSIDKGKHVQLEIIKAIFRAISHGSEEARLYIPYILILPDLQNNELTNEFNEQLNLVPEWMFITHISQILSNYDFANDSYLDNLVYKLASKYPNALYFPFKLSYENYLNSNQEDKKPYVKTINDLLSKKVLQNFMSSLQCLVLPEKLIDTHVHNFGMKLTENITNQEYLNAAKTLHENLFVKNAEFRGSEFGKVERGFEQKVKDFQNIVWSEKKEQIKKMWRSLQSSVDQMIRKRSKLRHVDLISLCSWLDNYKWSGDSDFIEIPGQYCETKPFIESHVKIVRFEQRLKVFNSKQKPLELKMLGSDGKIYSFIVKYGEDVRQDQRIQQVLQLMSKKFSLDKRCKENGLKIGTYQVIPINSYCGMLQIVSDALTINDFMDEISKNLLTETFEEFNVRIRQELYDFLHQTDYFKTWQKTYENVVLKHDRQRLIDKFKELESKIPSDIISRALKSIAKTLDSFYVLRKNFISSMAAMNIAHWLLGIGDRHLNNIMIDMTNGSLIGIDFGIAFGTAAILQVPELVPFRLTSHFVDVLEPLGIEGMMKKNMQYALKCLKNHSEIILINLEVFVKEPSLDWLMQSKKSEIATEGLSIWDPSNRIDIVRQKLNGVNPTKVLIDEISSGFLKDNSLLLQAYKSIIKEATEDGRRQLSNEDLTPEEQVVILVKLATNKTILASTYMGWSGWF